MGGARRDGAAAHPAGAPACRPRPPAARAAPVAPEAGRRRREAPACGAAAAMADAREEERELVERELAIGSLNNKMSRVSEKSRALLDENSRLTKELRIQRDNLDDMNEFLTNQIKSKQLLNAQLETDVAALQKEKEDAVSALERELEALRRRSEAEIAELGATADKYRARLNDLENFQDRMAELERALEDAKRELDEERLRSEETVSSLERKHVQEKDRLEKDMALRIKETNANIMRLTDNQLETTTKRTIMENEQITSELAYQSKHTDAMLHSNERLRCQVAAMRRDAELYRLTEADLAKRNHVYQKTVKTLLAKLKESEIAQREGTELSAMLEDHAQSLEQELHGARIRAAAAEEEARAAATQAAEAVEQLSTSRSAQDDLMRFLTTCLADLRAKTAASAASSAGDGAKGAGADGASFDELDPEQREHALTHLLDRLAAAQGLASNPSGAQVVGGAWPGAQTRGVEGGAGAEVVDVGGLVAQGSGAGAHAGADGAAAPRAVTSVAVQTTGVTMLGRGTIHAAFNTSHELRPWGQKSAVRAGTGGARSKVLTH